MTERIENYARIIGKNVGTYLARQNDLYTWIVTNHIVVYTLEEYVT